MKLITNVHIEWHDDTGEIHYVVEFVNGEKETICEFAPTKDPIFIHNAPEDSIDYQIYYRDALAAAYNKGYLLKEKFDEERLVKKVAAFIYATAVLNQEESSCHVYLDEIERHFGKDFFPEGWRKDIRLLKDIQGEIYTYPGCGGDSADTCWLDISGYDEYGDPCEKNVHSDSEDAFNLCLWTDYIACEYDAEDAD